MKNGQWKEIPEGWVSLVDNIAVYLFCFGI